MEPHISSCLSKYFLKLFQLQKRLRADYKFSFDSAMMYVTVLYE